MLLKWLITSALDLKGFLAEFSEICDFNPYQGC